MFRRILALMLSLCLLPILAQCEGTPIYQVFTFAGRLPANLAEPLSSLIPDESRILSGAAIQHNGNFYEKDEPASWNSYSAMLIVDTDEGPLLLAAAQVEDLPWQVNDFTRFLRQTKNVSVSIYQPEPNRIPLFSVDYPSRSGLISDLMIFRGNRLWQLAGYIDEGVELVIEAGLGTTRAVEGEVKYNGLSAEYFWMEYMADLTAFPTTLDAVMSLNDDALNRLDASETNGLCYTAGANLRQEPTANSASLGLYNTSVPLQLTGRQHPGSSYPWLEVCIGNTVGWMSGNYVYGLPSQSYPVPMGRTAEGCPMYANPGDLQPHQQLEPGTTFHILTEYQGMYHICIPQNEISWAVDTDGLYGYIPQAGVLTGASPSALDALENR